MQTLVFVATILSAVLSGIAVHRLGQVSRLIYQQRRTIMPALDDLKASVDKLVADFATYKDGVQKLIADAIAKDDADEEVDLKALKEKVDALDAEMQPSVDAAAAASAAADAPSLDVGAAVAEA
jgi:hypothetical protein